MSAIVISGKMGNFKTYEAVSNHLFKLLKEQGRHVVTNIYGLELEENRRKIAEFLSLDFEDLNSRLHYVDNNEVFKENFFPSSQEDQNSIVRPGWAVIVDEAWRFFPHNKNLPERVLYFFAEHRHLVDVRTSLTCEIILIIQNIRTLHRDLRGLCEVNYRCKKLKTLGLVNHYEVAVYEEGDRTASFVHSRTADKRIFEMYASHSVKGAKETVSADQVIWKNPAFIRLIIFAFVTILGGAYFAYSSLFDLTGSSSVPSSDVTSTGASAPVLPNTNTNTQTQASSSKASDDTLHIIAEYRQAGIRFVLVKRQDGTVFSYAPGFSSDAGYSNSTFSRPLQDSSEVLRPTPLLQKQ